MAQYMILIYQPTVGGPSPEEAATEMPKWGAYTQAMHEAGVHVAGDPLEGAETATTVRVRDGETVLTDGPFAETKELLAGYYILELPNLDEALRWAARAPNAAYGSIEVRPVMAFNAAGTHA